MTPLERLLAEEIPDGTFGGTRPAPEPRPATSPADDARHTADLANALRARHLQPVPDTDPAEQPKTEATPDPARAPRSAA